MNVNKGSFADPANITLQTKPNNKWVDVTAEGITVVPKKSGAKSVPSRLTSSDDGKIVIQDIEFSDGTIASRAGDNPAPIKVKKRSISDGKDHHADHHRQWRQVQRRDQGGFHRQGRVPGGSDRPDRGDRGARGRVTSPTMGAAPGTHTAKPSPSLYSKSPGSRRGFC